MSRPGIPTKPLTFEGLAELRRKTEVMSKFLQDQLQTHLDTLRPILAPDRIFGKYMGSKTESPLADRAFAQLQQLYRPFAARPFDLPAEFDEYWLALVGNRLTLYAWEYTHEARSEREGRSVAMSSPVRWVMSYTSAYTLAQLRLALSGKGERRPEHVRQFVVNALVTQLVMTHTPGLVALFGDLRYHVQSQTSPDIPQLPLTTITAGLPSFRPSDELILTATNFSGVPAFIELIDVDALPQLQDPLRARIEELVR